MFANAIRRMARRFSQVTLLQSFLGSLGGVLSFLLSSTGGTLWPPSPSVKPTKSHFYLHMPIESFTQAKITCRTST